MKQDGKRVVYELYFISYSELQIASVSKKKSNYSGSDIQYDAKFSKLMNKFANM